MFKLRSLIDELVSTNLKKKKDLNILNELHNKVKKCAEDSENFARAISPVKSQSKLQDSYIPAGFSPPRTSTTINDLKEENGEVIVEKIKELEGLLLNIKLLDEQEDETMNLLQERKKESYNDNVSYILSILISFILPILPM